MSGTTLFRCGDAQHAMSLSHRDIRLLDGQYFFKGGWTYRKLFGLDFIRGLGKVPRTGVVLLSEKRANYLLRMQSLLVALETQRDLISLNYSYGFEDEPKCRYGASRSGIAVEGGFGRISVRPAGYCDFTISDVGPNGRGRIVEIIDLRIKRAYPTLNRGMLKVYTRKAEVGWFDGLEALINFLKDQDGETLQISHEQ